MGGGGEETLHSKESWSSSFKKGLIFFPPDFDLKNVWSPRQPPAALANGGSNPHDLTALLQRLLVNRTLLCDGKPVSMRDRKTLGLTETAGCCGKASELSTEQHSGDSEKCEGAQCDPGSTLLLPALTPKGFQCDARACLLPPGPRKQTTQPLIS